ncbi:hypothetical protein [Pyrinomonas methylaliphatogenes]|uniref:hypothetical protein n=1 Tax=Pyrinomonas methylaliphatogenes TaxID=454194 RepID=UPI0012FD6E60|nr:hypothetical protein [Pyrinomonas methylaliphatogenes]MBX5479798.1 hypothetical protein [Pyrinomonas methylaliphatogenes]
MKAKTATDEFAGAGKRVIRRSALKVKISLDRPSFDVNVGPLASSPLIAVNYGHA